MQSCSRGKRAKGVVNKIVTNLIADWSNIFLHIHDE